MLLSESKDKPLGYCEEQTDSDNFFPAISVTMTLRSSMYATSLPRNDEQMKGLCPSLAYGRFDLIEKSFQRNEADESLDVKSPSNVFAMPIIFPSTGILSSSLNSRPLFLFHTAQ